MSQSESSDCHHMYSEEYLLRRQQAAADAIADAEGLTADLTDQQAAPVLSWATRQAAIIASDASLSDAEVEAMVALVRRAVRRAGYAAIGTQPAEQIIGTAQRALRELLESYATAPPEADDEPLETPPPPPYSPPASTPAATPVVAGSAPPPPPPYNPPATVPCAPQDAATPTDEPEAEWHQPMDLLPPPPSDDPPVP